MKKPRVTHKDGDIYQWGRDYRCNVKHIGDKFVCTSTFMEGPTGAKGGVDGPFTPVMRDAEFPTLSAALQAGFCSFTEAYAKNGESPADIFAGMRNVWLDEEYRPIPGLARLETIFDPKGETNLDKYLTRVENSTGPTPLPEMEF